ncbi:MAG: hypothetical protein KDC93_02445 [Cyclobacteriaceae bacterium]|nr:hypothetical protein [Cyclobacteriaceae bacterium]
MKAIVTFLFLFLTWGVMAQRYWVGTIPGVWNSTLNWSATSGGSGGASVPGPADQAIFNGAGGSNGNCNLNIAPNVAGITINGYTGTIDLLGFNLTTTGANSFSSGTISNSGGAASVILNTPLNTTFSGTVFNANLSGSSGRLYFNGSTFNGTVNVSKTDGNNDASTGNNIFNNTTIITNLGAGYVLLGNGNRDQFNGVTTFNNNGSDRFYFAYNHSGQTTTFASNLTISTNKSGGTDAWSYLIAEGSNTNVSFGGNVTINCSGTLQSNHRILQGNGSTATYTGNLTVNLTNTNSSTSISLGTNGTSSYNGNIIVSSSGGANGIFFNTTASASSVLAATRTITIGGGGFIAGTLGLYRFTQTGATTQTLNTLTGTANLTIGPSSQFGGNVVFSSPRLFLNGFSVAGTANLQKTGASDDAGTGGNIFNGVTTITNSGSGYLMTGNGNSDQFNALTTFNNTGSHRIYFGHNHSAQTTTFASDAILNSSKSGAGDNWSYLVAEGSDTHISFGGNVTINCGGAIRSDHRFLNGNGSSATYAGLVTINMTNTDASTAITMGQNGTSTYNANIVVSNANTSGITFNASSSATSTLNGSISIGSGYSSGSLDLYRFNQVGASANNITLTGNSDLRIGPDTEFDGAATFKAPQVYLNGCVFQSVADIEKTGATNDAGTGGNTFNGVTLLTNSGSGELRTGSTNPDIFNSNLTVNNTGSSLIQLAYNSAGNQFNGDVTLNSTSGSGIRFSDAGGGSSTMSAGSTINIGGSGFIAGDLYIEGLTQLGTTAMVLNLSPSSSSLRIGPGSTFGGDVSFSAPSLYLNGATFNGTAYLEKNGSTGDTGSGNNTFASTTTIVNNGTGVLRTNGGNTFNGTTTITNNANSDILLELNSGSTYNGDVTLTNNGTSNIRVAYGGATAFNGNIVVNSTNGNGIYFCENVGTATLADTKTITIGGSGFSSGNLILDQFTQIGTTAQILTLTGTARLRIGNGSTFNGTVSFIAPQLELNGCTYNGLTYLEKNGATNNNSTGANIFNGPGTTLVNSGSGYLLLGNTNPDIFNSPLTITNSGSDWLYLAHNSAGNQFNNNITFNNTGSANGILFSNAGGGSSTLGAASVLSIGGSGFNTGQLRLQRMTQAVGGTPQNLTLTGAALLQLGPTTTFEGDVTFTSPRLLLNGTTFNGAAQLEKTGTTNDDGIGGNIFNGVTILTNSGDSYLLTGNTNPDIFNSTLAVVNSGASTIRLANNSAGNQFNGNIELNSTFGGGIYFCNSGNGTATLAATRTISVGGFGVISGDVRLHRFTQVGATPQTLNLTGIATLTLGPASTFGGNVNFTAPRLLLNGTTFNGTATLEKNGANSDAGSGGNIFNSTTSITNSGSGYLMTANTSPDIFNGNLTVSNTGSNVIHLAYNTSGNQFNGDITFNSTLGSSGIYFAATNNGDATLANGASLLVGGLGYSSGELRLRRFTQIGTAPQTLLLTGTALLRIGPVSQFNGNLDFRAPEIALDGATYNGTSYLEKTGATNDDSSGGNIFNGPTTIANSGTGWIRSGLSVLDTFNGDLTLTNTGSSTIRMADNTPGTVFNGNIIINSTFGGGIYFSSSANGTSTLAAGRTISVGGTGFSDGDLRLHRFTQLGGSAQNLALTGVAVLRVGPSTTFNGNVNFSAPQLYLDGATYNGTATLQKTGAGSNQGSGNNVFASTTNITNSGAGVLRTNGNNTFNGSTTITNSGSADILLELNSGSTYNGNVIFTNTGTSYIRPAYNGITSFNGNITVNSTNGTGIYFSENSSGSSTLANTRTISVGGTGFNNGELRLERFTQTGATAQNISLTGNATFRLNNTTTWNGALTVVAPRIFLQNSVFNGAASFTKTDNNTDSNYGGNTFNGVTTFVNSAAGTFRLANNASDNFVGNVTFNQIAGNIQPAYNQPSDFRGNVTVNGASPITFAANNGTVVFTGSNAQTINRSGAAVPIFRRLQMNKASNTVTLNTSASVTLGATFTSGILNSDAINILSFADNATSTGGSNTSHIDGPVAKVGNDAFTFPTGDNGIFRTIAISAPSNTSHTFIAEYFHTPQAFGDASTYDPSFYSVSSCEFWTLDRTPAVGGSNVSVTLSWNSADCTGTYIGDPSTLRVTRWNGSSWVNHGNGGTTGNAATGTILSSGVVTAFSPFTLASTSSANPLPIELLEFVATPLGNSIELNWTTLSELNNDYFTVERSTTGTEFEEIGTVKGAGTTLARKNYRYLDEYPTDGISYYRLKQTDFDGTISFSEIARVDLSAPAQIVVYPNPIARSTTATLNYRGSFALFNSMGQMVLMVENSNELDTRGLPSGVYTIKSTNGSFSRLVIE